MLALISLGTIGTSACWLLGDSNLIHVTRRTRDVEGLLFMHPIRTGAALSINQEHSLSLDTIQTFEVRNGSFLPENTKTLLLVLLSAGRFGLVIKAGKRILSSENVLIVMSLTLESLGGPAPLGNLAIGLDA
jgi:hypothetical protein